MVETYQHTAAQPPIRSWGAAHVRLALCRLPFDVERDLYRTRVGDAQQDRAEMDGRWEVEEDRSLPALRQPALLDAVHKVRCRVLGNLGRNAQQVVVVNLRREKEEESGGRRCGTGRWRWAGCKRSRALHATERETRTSIAAIAGDETTGRRDERGRLVCTVLAPKRVLLFPTNKVGTFVCVLLGGNTLDTDKPETRPTTFRT